MKRLVLIVYKNNLNIRYLVLIQLNQKKIAQVKGRNVAWIDLTQVENISVHLYLRKQRKQWSSKINWTMRERSYYLVQTVFYFNKSTKKYKHFIYTIHYIWKGYRNKSHTCLNLFPKSLLIASSEDSGEPCIYAKSPESLLLAYTKYGFKWNIRSKFRLARALLLTYTKYGCSWKLITKI